MAANDYIARLRQAAKDDPKKAGILAVLVLVMLVMWGKFALTGKSEPASAVGAVNPPATLAVAGRTVSDNAARLRFSEHAERLSDWTRQPVKPLSRNLFAVNLTYYRRDGSNVAQQDGEQGFWEELAKSRAAQTDQKKARQILIENLQLQASQIKLQSTLMGSTPKAMVNGKLVGIGDVVAVETAEARTTFRVLKIEARGMIVEHEGIKLAISMK
jgi:hypothetical protein